MIFLVIFGILVEKRSHGKVCKSFGLQLFCLISNFLPKKAIVQSHQIFSWVGRQVGFRMLFLIFCVTKWVWTFPLNVPS